MIGFCNGVTSPDDVNDGLGPIGWCPRGTEKRIACRCKHAQEDKPEEETASGEESESTYKEDRKDARGDYERPEKQEVDGTAYETKGDADQDCEGDTREEFETHRKQDKEAETFQNVGDTDQRCEEDPERARHADKLCKPQFEDPEAHHVPGGRWLAQRRL
ncbi:hypothetical protein NDU88_004765 [Pleurodeles waltl]|uniref:Uncharacterized protein n=1 Tax=Pleurodeles waltl TaxID=8319 RepID=A0AAV7NUN7_PLEWA|nr:hypothetical protein NDU88_004765 [Pleurodeles waltl]